MKEEFENKKFLEDKFKKVLRNSQICSYQHLGVSHR